MKAPGSPSSALQQTYFLYSGPRGLGRREGPLLAGGESSAAASAQAGLADGVDDLFRGHLGQHLLQAL